MDVRRAGLKRAFVVSEFVNTSLSLSLFLSLYAVLVYAVLVYAVLVYAVRVCAGRSEASTFQSLCLRDFPPRTLRKRCEDEFAFAH